jgi:hypothetical protein
MSSDESDETASSEVTLPRASNRKRVSLCVCVVYSLNVLV